MLWLARLRSSSYNAKAKITKFGLIARSQHMNVIGIRNSSYAYDQVSRNYCGPVRYELVQFLCESHTITVVPYVITTVRIVTWLSPSVV